MVLFTFCTFVNRFFVLISLSKIEMKISKIIFLTVLALSSGQDPPDPDTTTAAETTEESFKHFIQ